LIQNHDGFESGNISTTVLSFFTPAPKTISDNLVSVYTKCAMPKLKFTPKIKPLNYEGISIVIEATSFNAIWPVFAGVLLGATTYCATGIQPDKGRLEHWQHARSPLRGNVLGKSNGDTTTY
jgi:hypothetical protein